MECQQSATIPLLATHKKIARCNKHTRLVATEFFDKHYVLLGVDEEGAKIVSFNGRNYKVLHGEAFVRVIESEANPTDSVFVL